MRRVLLILLVWLVPFQAVWSVEHALQEHLDVTAAHSHDHDRDHHAADQIDGEPATHADDGHHGSHGHAAFAFLIAVADLGLAAALAAQPPPALPASFTSHIPPLPDPPPAVRI